MTISDSLQLRFCLSVRSACCKCGKGKATSPVRFQRQDLLMTELPDRHAHPHSVALKALRPHSPSGGGGACHPPPPRGAHAGHSRLS
jgi:hypothetical protein